MIELGFDVWLLLIALYAFAIPSRLKTKLLFNVACIVPINLVIIFFLKSQGFTLSQLGFQLGSHKAWIISRDLSLLLIGILAAIAFLIKRKIPITKEFLLIMIAYPIWAVFQQFLVMSGSIMMGTLGWHPLIVGLVVALAFGFLHWPFKPLVYPTLVLGAILFLIFQTYKSLFPIAMIHGTVATCYYYWFLGRDIFTEKLKK